MRHFQLWNNSWNYSSRIPKSPSKTKILVLFHQDF